MACGYGLGLKAVTAILMPIGLTFVLLAEPIIGLMYGSEYDDAVLPLRLLGVMAILYGANSFASTLLISRDRPDGFTRVIVVVVIANIGLNLALIPRYGYHDLGCYARSSPHQPPAGVHGSATRGRPDGGSGPRSGHGADFLGCARPRCLRRRTDHGQVACVCRGLRRA